MKIVLPDYNRCVTGIPNSVLKYFGIEEGRKSNPLLDQYLQKDYENVVVLLLDGMGTSIIRDNLEPEGFFRTHLKEDLSSVFPPTTAAATTSVLSGWNPCEHGWLGWNCYYPPIDKTVTSFLNTEMDTDIPAADFHVAFRYTGYEDVIRKINRLCGNDTAFYSAAFMPPNPKDFGEVCERVKTLCSQLGKKYIYSYFNEPDLTMHRTGCNSEEAKMILHKLEAQVEALYQAISNTLLIITADHGQMNSKCVAIEDYPSLTECLVRMPSIESRALNLYVKPDKKEQFVTEFTREFGTKFRLYTRQEVIESKLFGPDTEHPLFREMLGDYLAVAVSDLTIFNQRADVERFIGVHAGMTEDEMVVPLIVAEK